jgi:adenylosuccinate synthase
VKNCFVVAGLAFGDCGKGSITDFLTRRHSADLVVRYNGAHQASHNVITPEGVHHTFSQFGSGTLAGARTFLSKYILIEPYAIAREADVLRGKGVTGPLSRLAVDPDCVVITPFHKLANRIREAARGEKRHGSVGLGVGEARADQLAGYMIHAGHVSLRQLFELAERKIEEMRPLREAAPELFRQMQELDIPDLRADYYGLFGHIQQIAWRWVARESDTVIFEGAQGVLLDEIHGFAPYNSWTDCTFGNADKLIAESRSRAEVTRVGVLRSYFTRHGPGPFPTERNDFGLAEPHNGTHPYMGPFRTGFFDAVLAKYAIDRCGGVDGIALTHLDAQPSRAICTRYELSNGSYTALSLAAAFCTYRVHATQEAFQDRIEELLGVPIRIESRGPTANDKRVIAVKEREAWKTSVP